MRNAGRVSLCGCFFVAAVSLGGGVSCSRRGLPGGSMGQSDGGPAGAGGASGTAGSGAAGIGGPGTGGVGGPAAD